MNSQQYFVAVRTLCEFTAKRGDLDLRFTPAPSAQEGIEGHQRVTARRAAGYEKEITLSADHGPLRVRGRADGFDPALGRLEEIKTFRGSLERQPANHRALHWAQAEVYGWLICQARGLAQVELALVYFDVGSQRETVFTRSCPAEELRLLFEQRCEAFLAWARQEIAHRAARDEALAQLAFPHPDFRPGQRPLAEAVYRAARAGRCLLAQAPTGIGKTIATLFPSLKAMPAQALDKVYFLTAKTSGRALGLQALQALRGPQGLPLRAIELVARDKACEHPDKACHGDACPLAKGFFDRLPEARQAALALPVWDKPAVRALAQAHQLCPYYLGQELVRWSDVAVGDYNHFFDLQALLHGMAQAQDWKVAVLVDEAHNLVDRARAMYTAELDPASLKAVRKGLAPALKKPLSAVRRRWRELQAGQEADYEVRSELPTRLLTALQQACAAIMDHMAERPHEVDATLQGWYFEALHFTRVAELHGPQSLFDLTRGAGGDARLCLRNVVPATHLAPRFASAHTATLFSATLQPASYYREMLGLPQDTACIEADSPFEASQLQVRIARDISTRYQHRGRSLDAVVALIAGQYHAQPGNYLAFFSSFDYLREVAQGFTLRHPDIPAWMQARGMSEADQAAFLQRFVDGGQGIGFAVLGGAFSEGIDLPGRRLIGAFIATLGLPQVNPVNEQFRERLEALCGAGFDYTYLFPGLQKVVQAAGRVIRTPEDRGVVHLLDDRFQRPAVRRLLPRWWRVQAG